MNVVWDIVTIYSAKTLMSKTGYNIGIYIYMRLNRI